MARHIYFIVPEESRPTGGINVIFRFAEILRDHGMAVSVHYSSPSFVYSFFDSTVETTYSPHAAFRRYGLGTLKSAYRDLKAERPAQRPNANRLSTPSPEDLIVIPEFWYGAQVRRFPGIPHVVLSQAYTTTLEMVVRLEVGGGLSGSFRGYIATSRICEEAARMFSSAPVHHVPLYLDPTEHSFAQHKERMISFMPRRREAEAQTVTDILRSTSELRGFRFVAINGMQPPEVRDILSRSLIFLSFSEREGFGLPPAEAMACGCIAIGYPGVGGMEYLTPEVACPVHEDNSVAFLRTVLEVVREYRADPARLDAMRRKASHEILSTYTKQKTTVALLKAMAELAT